MMCSAGSGILRVLQRADFPRYELSQALSRPRSRFERDLSPHQITRTHEELDTHHKCLGTHRQSTPRAGEGLPAGAARLGRAALCLPYHLSLHATQKRFPDLKIACDADDTYLGARPAVLYPGYAALRADTLESCGTRSKLAKVVAYTRAGSHRDIPAEIPGSAYYVPVGSPSQDQVEAAAAGEAPRARGMKVVGAFKGDADWCGAQLGTRLQRKLGPLDRLDILS